MHWDHTALGYVISFVCFISETEKSRAENLVHAKLGLLLHHVIDFKHLTNLYYLLKCMDFAIKYEKLTCSFQIPKELEGYTVLDY